MGYDTVVKNTSGWQASCLCHGGLGEGLADTQRENDQRGANDLACSPVHEFCPFDNRNADTDLDDLIRKQRCDEGDSDQTAKKDHVRHSFDLKTQFRSVRIADRQTSERSQGT